MFLTARYPIPLQALHHQLLTEKEISLWVLRTDQNHAIISGNKWFKLKYNLIAARQQGYQTIVSFGGPYSNHLHALAAAGKAAHFNTIGIIRGEEHRPLNPTLSDAVAQGMKLYYINRASYRNKDTPEVLNKIKKMIAEDTPFAVQDMITGQPSDDFYLLPEGGTNELALKGAAEIADFIPDKADYVCVPCGTGGTIAGIITGLNTSNQLQSKVLGFPAMKGGQFLQQTIMKLLKKHALDGQKSDRDKISTKIQWELFHDYHFGGFGKMNQTLALFIREFEENHGIELDPIYTAKMMYAIVKLIEDDYFPRGSSIVAVHTGGLQGKRGMEEKIQTLVANSNDLTRA